jgi:hypothetical protein
MRERTTDDAVRPSAATIVAFRGAKSDSLCMDFHVPTGSGLEPQKEICTAAEKNGVFVVRVSRMRGRQTREAAF